ncbi:hypothetical protein KW807_00900 [Candidatus Parcubacteria bacterium]|nr:hypothetical protein [Candidatus Parcubacteria bacterium]
MFKKSITLIVIFLLLVAGSGWFVFMRGSSVPVGEAIKNILPFGSSGEDIQPTTDNQRPTTIINTNAEDNFLVNDESGKPVDDLLHLSSAPVAGAVSFISKGNTVVRYVDRATGHIYDVTLPGPNSSSTPFKSNVTNQTIPKIYSAHFRPDGGAVLLRYLKGEEDVVENLSLTLTPPTATSTDSLYGIAATTLRGDISAVAVGTGNTLFYALSDSGAIVSSTFNNPVIKTLFTSTFTEWGLRSAGNTLWLTTKPSGQVVGRSYILNTSTNSLNRVLGPMNGLSVMPESSGTRVFYSYVEGLEPKSAVKNLKTGAVLDILPVTLADKCAWSIKKNNLVLCGVPDNGVGVNEPDNWYQGRSHYSDRLWLYNTTSEITQVILEPKSSFNLDLDIYQPQLSPNEDYLIFINKSDLSLWAFKLGPF